jgi:hypothetical protein
MMKSRLSTCRLGFCLLAVLLAGCFGIPTYPDTAPKNLTVRTQVNSGSKLTNVWANLDIHRVTADCDLDHIGRIELLPGSVDVGVSVDELRYLEFIFGRKVFMSSTSSAVRYGTLHIAKPGYVYDAQANYDSGIYSVVMREARQGTSNWKTMEQIPLKACKRYSANESKRK